ncbi:hypothetical protein [Patulibacter defluvii]|uniref:hypothetical protein n=1 Tax=Patulibacter defluvii TaxID=3095358 RepID=UPI002A75BFAD|nr:hypothetical protein [Patulibacter sp. DM4]
MAVALALTAFPAPARAADGDGTSAAEIRRLADTLATAALSHQNPEGLIHDPVKDRYVAHYGPAGFGYAGLRAAQRNGDPELLERALRAVLVSARQGHATPFDQWLTAKSYAFAQRHFARSKAWLAAAPKVAAYLDQAPFHSTVRRPSPTWTSDRRYNNWKLVELAARAVALDAGRFPLDAARRRRLATISGMAANAAAGPAPVNTWLGGSARVLSDPTSNPLAYAVLSAVALREARRARPAIVPGALAGLRAPTSRFLLSVAGPDGTVAWSGRSAHLSWTLVGSMIIGIDRGDRDGRGLAHAAWRQLNDRFGVRPDGYLAIAPVLRRANATLGLDGYADMVIYGGLTTALLNDAADALEGQPPLTGGPPSATRSGTFADPNGAGVAAARRGDVWWAATTRASDHDLRFQPGLQLVQVRTGAGWENVLPVRPRRSKRPPLWPAPAGCVWRTTGTTSLGCGRRSLRIATRGERVAMELRLAPGERAAGWLYVAEPVRDGARTLRWRGGSLQSSGDLQLRVDHRRMSSASDPDLQAVRYAVRADRRGRAVVSIGR